MYSEITSNKRRTWLLIVVFVGIVMVLGYAMDWYFEAGGILTLIALAYALITTTTSYFAGDKIALALSGAKEIEKKDAPELFRLVENLSIANGTPMPKVHIIEDDAPNAFATGRDPKHGSVAFTTGLIRKLDRSELEGVVAHELSHIKNYDIRTMTIVVVLVGTVAIMADLFLRGHLFGGGSRRKEGGGILLVVGIIMIILAPLIAQLIKLAVSRQREYLADASASLLTRYPEGLARALEKISSTEAPLKRTSTATAHLFISSPFGRKKSMFTGLFATHPPAEERVKRLRTMGA